MEKYKGSRTKNSFINGSVGSFSQIASTFLNFIVRTIFIHCLGREYLGINGLFSNILYILNFAELGIGNAVIYNLYKPIAEDNKERIKALVNLYKKIYVIIGIIVLLLGFSVIPFMDYIIKEPPKIRENLILIYILYLLETSGTYFFGYNRSVLLVYQKSYITSLIELVFSLLKSFIQALILIFMNNFILYLLVYVLSTLFSNIYISFIVRKKYSFLKEKNVIKVSKEEVKEIFKNVKSLFLYKLGNTVLSGTDNIILSMLVGISAVGLYSNYSLIITAVSGILWSLLSGLTGSIGNLNVYKDKVKQKNIFEEVLFVSCLLYGFGMVCICLLINSFITIWIGREYLISQITVIYLVLVCYLRGIVYPANAYRDTLGLFNDGKVMPLISSVINIILSFLLGYLYGMMGVFLATLISIVTTTFWYMPKIIYNKIFNFGFNEYMKKIIVFTLPFVISYIFCINIFKLFLKDTFLILIIKGIIVLIITLSLFILIEHNQREYKEVKRKVINLIRRKI